MTIVGFNFNKISVERKAMREGKIEIKNNVNITKVEETDLSLGKSKQNGLKFTFEFTSLYEPDAGSILLAGELFLMEDEKKAKEILESWKKNKRLSKEVMTPILNTILTRCNVEALILSRDVNLPPPVQLPKVVGKSSK